MPHVHIHVIPRLENDGGLALPAMFPKVKSSRHSFIRFLTPAKPQAPPIGSVEPDFAALGKLAEALAQI